MADKPDLMAGIYDSVMDAERAIRHFEAAGVRPEKLMLETEEAGDPAAPADSKDTVTTIGKDAAIGGVIGGALGAGLAGVVAPVVFVAAPVVGPLMALGYGATIGGTVGAVSALRIEQSEFSKMLEDALRHGSVAVLVRVGNDEERETAERVFEETTAERRLAH